MERFMYQDDSFEQVLKQRADEYRMYPSDQSWDIIYQRMHQPGRFRWGIASFFTMLLVGSGLWVSINQHEVKPAYSKNLLISEPLAQTTNISRNTNKPVQEITPVLISKQTLTVEKPVQPIITAQETPVLPDAVEINETIAAEIKETVQSTEAEILMTGAQELRTTSLLPAGEFAAATKEIAPLTQIIAAEEPDQNQTDADLNYEVKIPVLTTKKPEKQLQYYITPSTSYRVLVTENKYNFGNIRDPRSAISQQPFLGLELGVAFIKPISKNISFSSGLQFNFTSYVVTGSKFSPEVATVTLSPFRNIQRVTSLRTRDGYFDENILNKTLQVSVPLGIRLDLVEGKRIAWNLSTTIQPTYLIAATGYMLTNDYKNYIKAPEFLKKFNLNYGLETFVRLKSKNSEFQLGPQLRYQLLSNAKASYPIKEHLIDYGVKIGFIKNLK